jgi:hypothetical protein
MSLVPGHAGRHQSIIDKSHQKPFRVHPQFSTDIGPGIVRFGYESAAPPQVYDLFGIGLLKGSDLKHGFILSHWSP